MSRRPFKWATARKCTVRGVGHGGRPKVVNFMPGRGWPGEEDSHPHSAACSSLLTEIRGAGIFFEKNKSNDKEADNMETEMPAKLQFMV